MSRAEQAGEVQTGIRSVLKLAWAYEAVQRMLGKNKLRRRFVDEYVQPQAGQRVLDFGCGPGDLVPFLTAIPGLAYTGFDISTPYVRSARERFGDRGAFFDGSLADLAVDAPFDLVVAIGVFHHIPDQAAHQAMKHLRSLLAPSGRLIATEPHLHDQQHWIARELIKRDRGNFVRLEAEYTALFESTFDDVSFTRDERLLRVPYSLTVFTCR